MTQSTYYSRAGSYSRSYNAEVAEDQGRAPLSRAKLTVVAEFRCTQAAAAAALLHLHDGEWHHVGKFAACVDYFDTRDHRLGGVIAHITACGGAKKWAARRDALRADRGYGGRLNGYVYEPQPGRIVSRLNYLRREAERRENTIGFCPRDWLSSRYYFTVVLFGELDRRTLRDA